LSEEVTRKQGFREQGLVNSSPETLSTAYKKTGRRL
jgi:hypothetical protein